MRDNLEASPSCCSGPDQPIEFPVGLADQARLYKALGDEVRLKLLYLVRDEEVCVCDLTAVLSMAQGTLSHHLSVLHQAGLVTARKQGRWNYYQATPFAKRLGAFTPAEA
jgi:ArsR family transcriptional regulator